jgi:hypothetical protein
VLRLKTFESDRIHQVKLELSSPGGDGLQGGDLSNLSIKQRPNFHQPSGKSGELAGGPNLEQRSHDR